MSLGLGWDRDAESTIKENTIERRNKRTRDSEVV